MLDQFGDNKLTKVGVFYDGNYFAHVSNYYNYSHSRRQRLSVSGLHEFIRSRVAQEEGVDIRFCQIVDAHYFRGRLSAMEAQTRNTLFNERAFDHVLMNEGVVTHYLPLGPSGEKGIDVWLALEAFELAIFKRFNVVVLIACDGDYVPLVRKLNALGVRVMVLGWDFKVEVAGEERTTTTSQKLLEEVTYPIMMNLIIDDKTKAKDALINNLFVTQREIRQIPDLEEGAHKQKSHKEERYTGSIKALKQGFGFIRSDAGLPDHFFYWADCEIDFNELQEGQRVSFKSTKNDKGCTAKFVAPI